MEYYPGILVRIRHSHEYYGSCPDIVISFLDCNEKIYQELITANTIGMIIEKHNKYSYKRSKEFYRVLIGNRIAIISDSHFSCIHM